MRGACALVLTTCLSSAAAAQAVPQPFPRPDKKQQVPQPTPTIIGAAPVRPVQQPPADASEPLEGSLGVPIHVSAQYITSYDAGRGQRFYLYGTNAPFAEIVQYYKTTLKQRGDLVFAQPPIHQFDLGRFREETMAFPPSLTVKDYTWNGSAGYINPKRGAEPARFATIIQIVPNPPPTPR